MDTKNLNDTIIEIFQDLNEIQSMIKVLKESIQSKNNEIFLKDIDNVLEILMPKTQNSCISLNKYIDIVFE
ncbi:MAG: hypothetical protein PHC64_10105 [Candidatus Gastranaerophilales bacterium]|nr:hypothetical protein [Candidatus Gastranaerophilales bacterium]